MFLLRSSVAALAGEIAVGTLIPRLTEQFRHAYGHSPGPAEVRSWERSLPAAVKELRAAGLDELDVLVEWRLPLTSKRVDLAVLGQHPRGGPSCLLIENKQWSRAELEDPAYRMVTVDGVGGRERLHPQEQVRGYVEYLQDFNKYLSAQPAAVAGMVLLHNATSLGIASLRAPELAELAAFPMFTADDSADAQAFLRSRLAPTAAPQVADDVLHSVIGPSKQLLDHVSEEIRTGDQYTLLDEQRAAFEVVLRAVERSRRGDHKQAIIVTGGPGSGKSVIAITLLAELAKQGRDVTHATGSRSFTTTLREVVGRRERRVKALFRYFNVFGQAEPNSLDVLLADEAHRIRETSNYRFTPAAKRSSIPQVDELLRAARVPVFLLDEHQGVRPGEIGRVAEILTAADRNNIDAYEIDLDGQFRCGGSPGYLLWVKRLLELEPGGPIPWNPDDPFKLLVVDSPERLEQVLAQRLKEGYGARMAAGFCWKWSDPNPDRTLVDDVVIGDWRRPWNLRSDRPLGDIPSSSLWATDPAGFKQVGCIYTAQGFEYDWAGVIIGPDLVWRGDRWQTNPAASADKELRRAPNFDILVRNVYKVLLTRGLIGCVLYSTDPETQALLTRLGIPSKARPLDGVASTAPIRSTPHREPAFPGTGEQTSQAPPADRSRAGSTASVPPESVVEQDNLELQSQGTVFISYCHKDTRWLQRLLVHLKPLERQGVLDIWEDSRIRPGTPWREEIKKALDAARLAVLLISADFLASDFIMDDELPTLLKSAEVRGTIVIPLIVGPSRFSRTTSISRFQAINSPDLPLTRLAGYQREELLVRLTNSIEEALRNPKVVS